MSPTRSRARLAASLAACLICLPGAGLAVAEQAVPEIAVRTGEHPGFGRVVFDLPPDCPVRTEQLRDEIRLHFAGPVRVAAPDEGLPRNVRALAPEATNEITIRLAENTQARILRMRGRLVIDARDPPRPGHAAKAASPSTPEVETVLPTLARMAPAPETRRQPPPAAEPIETILPTLARLALPISAPTPPAQTDAAPSPPPVASLLFPFPRDVGAASLERAGQVLLVFDLPRQVRLPADGPFSGATETVLAEGLLVSIPTPNGARITLSREKAGWRASLEPGAPLAETAVERPQGTVLLRTPHPGRSVTIPDPESGAVLLVGTETEPDDHIGTGWQTPEFAALPTTLGTAVEPYSDRVQLAPEPAGFRIGSDAGVLALSAGALPGSLAQRAATLTQALRLPDTDGKDLRARISSELRAAARAPALARTAPRLALARTLLAARMEDDALGVLRLAAAADPNLAEDPRLVLMRGAAEVLADRPDQAGGLSDPHLPADDDVALWRALRDAEAGAPPAQTAPVIARTAPLMLGYPEGVGQALLPLAVETMIAGGHAPAARAFLAARPDDATLAFARAMEDEATGNIDGALARYDRLAAGKDRLVRIRAALHAIDLRVAHGKLGASAAADALARLGPAWRGDRIELARLEREAELRGQAGDPGAALAELRDALVHFPAEASDLRQRMRTIMGQALAAGALHSLQPAALADLLGTNPDIFRDALAGASPETRQRALSDLLSRDLPVDSAPVLARLIEGAPPDAIRAALGARLAELNLATGEDQQARQALQETAADGIPPALAAHRAVLAARLQARGGDASGAIAALAGIPGGEAEIARADLAEGTGDYAAAASALLALAERTVPSAGGLLNGSAQKVILRLAADAARSNEQAALDEVRTRWLDRLPQDEAGKTVRLLLAPPIKQLADLPRAAQEARLAADVASGLNAPTPGLAKAGR